MHKDELLRLTDAYFNGELHKEEEQLLFSALSLNEAGREYFRESFLLKSALHASEEPVPEHLDAAILAAATRSSGFHVLREFASPRLIPLYAAVLCIFIFSFFLYARMENYRADVDNAMHVIRTQQNTIELLINGLPAIQVTPVSHNEYDPIKN